MMKKILFLLVVLLAIVGRTFAQDIWSCGMHDVGEKTGVGLYKNGERVKSIGDDGTYDFSASDVIRWNGHTYMAYQDVTNDQAYIWDYESDYYLLLNSANRIFSLFTGDHLYAVGTKKVNGVPTAAQWHMDDGYMVSDITFGDGVYTSSARCGLVGPDGNCYVGGHQFSSPSTCYGVIWKNGEVFYCFQEQTSVKDIFFYDASICVLVEQNCGPGQYSYYLYQNNLPLYSLADGNTISSSDFFIDGGDIYLCSFDGSQTTVWKNETVLYTHAGSSLNIKSVCANSNGVYYCGKDRSEAKIWKDGEELYSPSGCSLMEKIYVEEPECTAEIQKTPYFEGFETGDTGWECWTKLDLDNDNGTDIYSSFASYWDRGGMSDVFGVAAPASGEHCALHRYGDSPQEGWLISPRIFLEPNQPILTFNSFNVFPEDYDYDGVLISTHDNPTKLDSYTEIWSPDSVEDEWEEIRIDLSAYAGKRVYIAFKYAGNLAHTWLIDDVSVTDAWTPCPSITEFPFVEEFGSGIPSCWYVFDLDSDSPSWGWNGTNAGHQPGEIFQKGALYTPYFQLTEGANYTLTFKTYFEGLITGTSACKMGISLDKTGVPYFSDFTVIWQEDFSQSGVWRTVTLDLSEYAGHTICLAFAYLGEHAYYWGIDDVTITEALGPSCTLTTEAYPSNGGTVDGGGTYPVGTEVTVTAKPAEGYRFVQWNDGVTENPRKVILTEDRTLTAIFAGTGVDEYVETTLNISPNPVTDLLRIEGVNPEERVEIYNSLGVLVKVTNTNTHLKIQVGNLASGLYMIRCGNKTARFVKS